MGKSKIKLLGILAMVIISCAQKDSSELKVDMEGKTEAKKVLVIGIDGCRPDGITAANTPNLDALMANGTYSLDARNTGIT